MNRYRPIVRHQLLADQQSASAFLVHLYYWQFKWQLKAWLGLSNPLHV